MAPAAPKNPYEALANPVDREHVAESVVAAASSIVARAALFMVKGVEISGWKAGAGLAPDVVAALRFTLGAPTIFKDAVEDKANYKGPVLSVPQNLALLEAMGGGSPLDGFACPLVIKGKVVAVLYGDNGDGKMLPPGMDKVAGLMNKASLSLEILIMKTKILS